MRNKYEHIISINFINCNNSVYKMAFISTLEILSPHSTNSLSVRLNIFTEELLFQLATSVAGISVNGYLNRSKTNVKKIL